MIAGRFAKRGLAIFSAVLLTAAYVSYQGGILRLPRGWAGSMSTHDAGRSSITAPTTMPAEGNHENWPNTELFTASPTEDAQSATLGWTNTAYFVVPTLKHTTMMSSSKSGAIFRPDDVWLIHPQPPGNGVVVLQRPLVFRAGAATQPAN